MLDERAPPAVNPSHNPDTTTRASPGAAADCAGAAMGAVPGNGERNGFSLVLVLVLDRGTLLVWFMLLVLVLIRVVLLEERNGAKNVSTSTAEDDLLVADMPS